MLRWKDLEANLSCRNNKEVTCYSCGVYESIIIYCESEDDLMSGEAAKSTCIYVSYLFSLFCKYTKGTWMKANFDGLLLYFQQEAKYINFSDLNNFFTCS